MERFTKVLICAAALAAVATTAFAEDGWTSPLGRFGRALARQRQLEADMAKEFPNHHIAFDPTLENPYYVVQDYHRLPHVYLDRRRFFHNTGNLRIDYRSLAGMPDERRFVWTPYEYGEYASGGRGHGWGYDGAGPHGPGGRYFEYGSYVSGVTQVVPFELRDGRPSGHYFVTTGRGGAGRDGHGRQGNHGGGHGGHGGHNGHGSHNGGHNGGAGSGGSGVPSP